MSIRWFVGDLVDVAITGSVDLDLRSHTYRRRPGPQLREVLGYDGRRYCGLIDSAAVVIASPTGPEVEII
ncbi:hypothetical protein [Mycobacterium lepromatosis]|uniref:hypothetical protein n=1 Tax=Mycobacterium lepromatosis TaxID=480418 RepID=UPI0005F819A7|nr:hypothetical protein [Mycobacterium lepromatosis]